MCVVGGGADDSSSSSMSQLKDRERFPGKSVPSGRRDTQVCVRGVDPFSALARSHTRVAIPRSHPLNVVSSYRHQPRVYSITQEL